MAQGNNTSAPIHVLVVDDSAVVRQVMQAVLSQEPDMVVTVAADPLIAMHKMKAKRPNVILLDLEMPRMDGLTFLRKLMAENPIPTLVCSGVAGEGTATALRALDEGALGIVTKPKLGVRDFLHESALMLIDMVRSAAQARIRPRGSSLSAPRRRFVAVRPEAYPTVATAERIIAIGASTGGTEALSEILTVLPVGLPGIVVVQHMPEHFTAAFAKRLNDLCQIEVKEGEDGDCIIPGRAIIAPGNRHLSVVHSGRSYRVSINDGPLISRHRPSVDGLFRSVASCAQANALGVILTGMGNDGAAGMLEMKRAGAHTIAQDESTSVVFGMPREAIALGAVDSVLALSGIAGMILSWAHREKMEPHPLPSL
jgi:two-component system, chemotaxis family, protein-glutamate methylesterase/glutaminase